MRENQEQNMPHASHSGGRRLLAKIATLRAENAEKN
jgi:hypothetical protein